MKRALSRKNLWDTTPRWLKRAAAPIIGAIPPAWVLGRQFRKNLAFVRDAERWSADQAIAYQLEQLQKVCALAYERSAFYRDAFQKAGFEPGDLRRIENLRGLPLIDRSTVRENLSEMCARSPHGWDVDFVSTGGTRGEPLNFYMAASRSPIEFAYLVASWQRGGFNLGMPMAVLRSRVVPPDARGLRHEHDPLVRQHHYSTFHMTDDNMRRYIEHMRGLGSCVLHAYPSAIDTLARFLRHNDIDAPANFRGLIAESEIVYPEQRRLAQETFACPYFSCYGHTEKLVLAAECEHSTDYHVWPTYGYFELLDENGDAVTTPGQVGEIVGTGFINTVVPFIRYRTGDFATYAAGRCTKCGREHTTIREIRGHRIQEVLVATDGSEIPWTALNMHDDTFDHVHGFQLHQDIPGRALLRIVPAAGFSADDERRIHARLDRKLAGLLQLDIQCVDTIPLSPRGKTIYVDQELPLTRPKTCQMPADAR